MKFRDRQHLEEWAKANIDPHAVVVADPESDELVIWTGLAAVQPVQRGRQT